MWCGDMDCYLGKLQFKWSFVNLSRLVCIFHFSFFILKIRRKICALHSQLLTERKEIFLPVYLALGHLTQWAPLVRVVIIVGRIFLLKGFLLVFCWFSSSCRHFSGSSFSVRSFGVRNMMLILFLLPQTIFFDYFWVYCDCFS